MTTAPGGQAASAGTALPLSRHIARTLHLAVPVMLARAGVIIMISVDTAMTGWAGAGALAEYAIALAPHFTLMVIGIGLMSGTVVLVAQADGAGRPEACGQVWHMAMVVAAGLGLAIALAMIPGEAMFLLLGQTPALSAGGGRALLMFAPGMPAVMLYIATTFFLEGIGRPRAGMVIALGANLVNAALNWILIEGHLGAPAMGAAGAALATSLTRWLMLLALGGYALVMAGGGRYGVRSRRVGSGATLHKLLRIGAPLSVATGLESGAFATIALFAGRLGEVALGGYQIGLNVVTFVFMLAIGLSTATAVRVANAVGRYDRAGAALAGWTGFGLVVVLMLAIGALIHLGGGGIAALYTDEAAVLAVATPALALVAVMVVVDGGQAVLLGALRGVNDVAVPTAMYAFSFWAVSVPLGYLLGLRGGLGVTGLFVGLLAGLGLACALLGWRFARVSRREVHPL